MAEGLFLIAVPTCLEIQGNAELLPGQTLAAVLLEKALETDDQQNQQIKCLNVHVIKSTQHNIVFTASLHCKSSEGLVLNK